MRTPTVAGSPVGRLGRAWPFLCAFGLYLALALAIWWHLLEHGFGDALPAGSADPGQEVWFLGWLPHALGAGLDPFVSHAIFAPAGVNLLDNTSIDLLGLLLAPVTVTAGPVASLDTAVLLAPALSGLGAFALCRRHVTWQPAAFAGGLCYGFGPFLTGDLRYGHLDLTWLVLPPLILCCLDTLLVAGTRRPVLVGVALGVLVDAQFFISTEMLAISALTAVVAAIVVSIGWPKTVLARLAAGWRGLLAAFAIVVGALAYPFWVVVAGPRHIVGPVWQHMGDLAASLAATIEPRGELPGVAFISGSNGSYLGVALLVVLGIGAAVLWRSPVLRVALSCALVVYVASLGYRLHVGQRALDLSLPAALLGHVPLLDSIVPERFAAMVDLLCGLALAAILDHLRRWQRPHARAGGLSAGDRVADGGAHGTVALTASRAVSRTASRAVSRTASRAVSRTASRAVSRAVSAASRRVKPAPLLVALSLAVGAFALVPFSGPPRWLYPVTGLRRPPAILDFTSASLADRPAAAGPAGGAVPDVAIYPDTSGWIAQEMVWQAQLGFSFTLADGYAIVPGPRLHAVESPPTDALWLIFAAASLHRLHLPLARTTRGAVRSNLRGLGIHDVVVLPGAPGSREVRQALREVLGPPTMATDGAVRWRVDNAAARRTI